MSRAATFFAPLLFILFVSSFLFAQSADDVKPSVVAGDVTTITDSEISLRTAGGDLKVTVAPATEFKRVPADNPKLSAAVAVEKSDIGVGDRLAISGFYSKDKTSLAARTVYLMSKSDIAERQRRDAERWSARGISGKVTAVDTAASKITVEMRGLVGATSITVTPKENAVFKRYAPNSVKYSESVPGTLANIQVGDMFRAVGDRSQDGQSFAAEEILTGSFETIAGTVKSINIEKNEITITDLQTEKELVVELGSASLMKRFPAEMAQRLAAFQGGTPGQAQGAPGARPVAGQRPEGGRPPQANQPAAGAGQQRPGGMNGMGMGGMARGGIDEMLERFPNTSAADLKVGDLIAFSSTKDHAEDRARAIKLLAGIEPFIQAARAAGMLQRSGARGGMGSFTIPGLDGVDFQ